MNIWVNKHFNFDNAVALNFDAIRVSVSGGKKLVVKEKRAEWKKAEQ